MEEIVEREPFKFRLIEQLGTQYTYEAEYIATNKDMEEVKIDPNSQELMLSNITQHDYFRTNNLFYLEANAVRLELGKFRLTFTRQNINR